MQKNLIDKRLLTLYDKNIKYTGSILNKNTTYKENDIIFFEGAILKVTVAGTTDSTLKAIRTFLTTAKTGDTIVSGTATLKLMSLTDDIVIEDWKSKTNYIVNNVVMNDNKLYRCTKAHTSTTDIYADIANWEYIAPFHDWKTSTQYVLNDIVINDKKIYRCTTAHTSTKAFDETKWEEISALENTVRPWATKTDYKANDLIYIDNVLYKCNTAHTSTTFSADVSKWDNMYSNIRDFADNTFYKKGSYVLYNNNIYKALKDTTGDISDRLQLQSWTSFIDTNNTYTKVIGADSQGYRLLTEPNGNYINTVIDLGAICDVTKVTLSDFTTGGCHIGETAIETSTDGTSYIEADSFTGSGYVDYPYGHYFQVNINEKARYIKIVFKSVYSAGGNGFNIRNVSIYIANKDWQKITNTQKPTIEAWTSNTDYSVNEVVIYNNKLYRCNKAHTSTTDFGADKLIYWNSLNDNPIINDWASGTTYEVGSMVLYNDRIYRCITSHTSSSFSSDRNNWVEISPTSLQNWQASIAYPVDSIVLYDNSTGLSSWVASTSYAIGNKVVYDDRIYECSVANSDSDFTASKWNQIATSQVNLYKCITANNDANFTPSKWLAISSIGLASIEDIEAMF